MDFLRLLAAERCGALDTFFSGLTYFGSEIAFMAAALMMAAPVALTSGRAIMSFWSVRSARSATSF